MILTPGQLYFINEQDVQTGARSNYYKIGIVRDSEDRDSRDRLLEHQTGNPRKLCIVKSLTMPAVETIETNLHYLFARNRIMGEWMQFSDAELQRAIDKATELAKEMEDNIEDFKLAEILKDAVSIGSKIVTTAEAQSWYGVIQDFREALKTCNSLLDAYDKYLYSAIESGIDVSDRAIIQTRAGAERFDEKLFSTNYPELYAKYSSSTFPVKGSFRVTPAKNWNMDISVLDQEQLELVVEFKEQLANSDQSMETGFALHEKHLCVIEIKKYLEWKIAMANLKLRVMTGKADGIEGICTWKREQKEVIKLDKKKLQSNFPDEYKSCVFQGEESKALIVEPKVAHI